VSVFVCVCVTNGTVEVRNSDPGGRAIYCVGFEAARLLGFRGSNLSVVRVARCAVRVLGDRPIPRPGD